MSLAIYSTCDVVESLRTVAEITPEQIENDSSALSLFSGRNETETYANLVSGSMAVERAMCRVMQDGSPMDHSVVARDALRWSIMSLTRLYPAGDKPLPPFFKDRWYDHTVSGVVMDVGAGILYAAGTFRNEPVNVDSKSFSIEAVKRTPREQSDFFEHYAEPITFILGHVNLPDSGPVADFVANAQHILEKV